MTAFDGDAISRADREFLARLGDHPLAWNSFYGKPCPPQPDFGAFRPEEDNARQAKRKAFFATVIDWMLVNYAYREGAFVSKGGAISLVDGEIISLADLRARMAPWALLAIGPHGGIKMHSPVDDWLRATTRLSVRREEMRPDRPRPPFSTATGRRPTLLTVAISRGSRLSSRGSFRTTTSEGGFGIGLPTRRAGRGCRVLQLLW
jgi:hypothetical protein